MALDSLLRQVVLERDGYRCRRCGRTDRLQAAHIYPKGHYRAMRHIPANVVTLCAPCHLFWWHKNPIAAAAWIREELGDEAMDALASMAQQLHAKQDRTLTRIYLEQALQALHTIGGGARC